MSLRKRMEILSELDRYIDVLERRNTRPDSISVTKEQYEAIQAIHKGGRYRGFFLKIYDTKRGEYV